MTEVRIDFDRLLKLRLVVARFGEMDIARWWNTRGQLGKLGAAATRRGLPRTHYFAQARSVFAVAAHRCREVFDPPESATLWLLPETIEEEFETRWERWLDHAEEWKPFFLLIESFEKVDLKSVLQSLDLISSEDSELFSRLRRSAEGRAVPLPRPFTGTNEDPVASAHGQLIASRLPGATVLEGAIGQMKAILRGSEDNAIATFNASHRSIKDAIKRATELDQALSEPRLRDLDRARDALKVAWPFLRGESDVSEDLRAKAAALDDLLKRENFYRELPTIDQHASAIDAEYARRFDEALDARIAAYTHALDRLAQTPGWDGIDQDQQQKLAAPLDRGKLRDRERVPIPQLRSELDACETRLHDAIAELHRIVDGDRVATVRLGGYFSGGVETEEQLDAALAGIREECSRLIGTGKKVIVQ
jgi:hypothetical protein